MYLLDTNVISELRKVGRGTANPAVVRWSATQPATALYLSVISILELEAGILLIQRRDAAQASILRAFFDGHVMTAFHGRILSVDVEIAKKCAALHVPDRRPDADALIAATALHHNFTLVTRNIRDFVGTGVQLLNPWET